MSAILTVILFFVYTYSFGLGVGSLAKESENFFERNLMRFGIGLASVLTFGLLLNLLRIPVDWKIFLGVSLLILAFFGYKNFREKSFNFKINLSLNQIIVLVLFFITLYMYASGAFSYPFLEDDDSWTHAVGVKFVSLEKTVFAGVNNPFGYIDPYPPTYDMLLGILHQTNDSVHWTLKFFNALIISLSIIFFYFFAKEFFNNSRKALFATFILFSVPAYLSHFIWALGLAMTLYFVAFYATERIKHDKKWWIIAAIVIAPTIIASPTHSTYFGLLFILYFVTRLIVERKFLIYEFIGAASGVTLAIILWWLPMVVFYTAPGLMSNFLGENPSVGQIAGTGDRSYSIADFLCHSGTPCYGGQNMINNPIGIGVLVSLLVILGLLYLFFNYRTLAEKKHYYRAVLIVWFFFAFYAVSAADFKYKLSPFRAWMILAIPVALLSGEAISFILKIVRGISKNFFSSNKTVVSIITLLVLGLLSYGIVTTSFIPKYKVNTAQWPPGAFWTSGEEIEAYVWIRDNLPKNSKMFSYSNNGPIIGMDMFSCHWCEEVRDYMKNNFNEDAQQTYDWLKKHDYEYVIIDGQAINLWGVNNSVNKIQGMGNSGLFQLVFQNQGAVIFKI